MANSEKGSRKAAFSFLDVQANAPLPGLAASAANRIPRWLLVLIVVLYIGHGLFHRDPWRGEDMLGLALARTAAEALLRGDVSLLLLPQLADIAWNQQGALWSAIVAIFMLPVYLWAALNQAPIPLHLLDDVARVPLALTVAMGLIAVWKASDRFARRREAQPVDPLGMGPRSSSFGKTLGDCALLLTIAALGVVYPWHQLGTTAIALLMQGLLLWALATAPETPRRAAYQMALIVFASLLTYGIGLAVTQMIAVLCIFAWVAPYRLAAKEFLGRWLLQTIGLMLLWSVIAMMLLSTDRVLAWWQEGFSDWSILRWIAGEAPALHTLGPWIKESLWRWWPLWPIAIFGMRTLRQTSFSRAPHWAVPVIVTATAIAAGLIGPEDWRVHQIAPVGSLALIAAFGLLSLPRPMINLIDWFAVVLFTAVGIFVWLYWSALNFGIPQTLATRVPLLAPDVAGNANIYEVAIGLLATIAWVSLVVWRVSRGAPRLWRPVALSTGGVTLLWVLLTTLWLPAINRIQGQQALAYSLESGWLKTASQRLGVPTDQLTLALEQKHIKTLPARACVQLSGQSTVLDTMAVAITRLPISHQSPCDWKLGLAEPNAQGRLPAESGWRIVWQSGNEERRGRQQYLLLERAP